MIHPETYLVTRTNGPRPAGPEDECFYCQQKVGEQHLPACACRLRSVVLRVTIEIPILEPETASAHDIELYRNESSWCADNVMDDLQALMVEGKPFGAAAYVDAAYVDGKCLCSNARFEYVREATAEDEAMLDPAWLQRRLRGIARGDTRGRSSSDSARTTSGENDG